MNKPSQPAGSSNHVKIDTESLQKSASPELDQKRAKPEIKHPKPKILVVVGPTSSGKSDLAVNLAKLFSGEIVSCDSRQIYRGLTLGSGKVRGTWKTSFFKGRRPSKKFVYRGIIHHCLDYVSPKRRYSAALFQSDAERSIREILRQKKIPILCGGTGHWIDAVVFGQQLPSVKPNPALRTKLETQTTSKLFLRLLKNDPQRAANIDRSNKRRLIRALEIVMSTGKPVPRLKMEPDRYSACWLGVTVDERTLKQKIKKRLESRMKQGMLAEARALHRKQLLSYRRMKELGLEYKYMALVLRKKLKLPEAMTALLSEIFRYSKRQMTWWKRNHRILWIKPDQAASAARKFLMGRQSLPG